jgi:hypothetical protein
VLLGRKQDNATFVSDFAFDFAFEEHNHNRALSPYYTIFLSPASII